MPSLAETQSKQNVTYGLMNISDAPFEFFVLLDVTFTMSCIQELTHGTDADEGSLLCSSYIIIKALFTEVVTKYARMSPGQFRKQFLRETKVSQKKAQRNQIKMMEMSQSYLKLQEVNGYMTLL